MKFLKMGILLTLFFIVLTEKISLLNIGTGIVVGVVVVWLNAEQMPSLNSFNLRTMGLWLKFLLILIKEVIVSNFQVAQVVLSKKMPIAPHIVAFESQLKNDFLLTVYANAITLTPGTMTVDIRANKMQIHCLSDSYAEGLYGSTLEAILLKIEERTYG